MGRPGKGDVWAGPWRPRDPLIAATREEKIQGLRKLQADRHCSAVVLWKEQWGRGGKTAKRQITEDLKSLAKDAGLYFRKRGTAIWRLSDHRWNVCYKSDSTGRNWSQESSWELTEMLQWGVTRGALVQGWWCLRKEAVQEGILEAESAGGRPKKSLKAKRKANMFHGLKWVTMKIVILCVSIGNQRKEKAREWGPWEDAVLSSEWLYSGAYRMAMGRSPQAARKQSQQMEARIYEPAAQIRQLLYKSSDRTVITSSLSPGLFKN